MVSLPKVFRKAYKKFHSKTTEEEIYYFKVTDGDLLVLVNTTAIGAIFYEAILKLDHARYLERTRRAWLQHLQFINFETVNELERYLSKHGTDYPGV